MEDLPSWVPDWSNLRRASCFSLAKPSVPSAERATNFSHYCYRALGYCCLGFDFTADNALHVSGIRFDDIAQVGKSYLDLGRIGEEFGRTIRDWQTLGIGEDDRRAEYPYLPFKPRNTRNLAM